MNTPPIVYPSFTVSRYGRWFSDAPAERPTCKPVVCSQPSVAHGGLATGDTVRYKAGGSAVVVCDKGYSLKLSSNNKLVCREDGSWRSSLSNEFPQCQEKVGRGRLELIFQQYFPTFQQYVFIAGLPVRRPRDLASREWKC